MALAVRGAREKGGSRGGGIQPLQCYRVETQMEEIGMKRFLSIVVIMLVFGIGAVGQQWYGYITNT